MYMFNMPVWNYMYMMHISVSILEVTSCGIVICDYIGIN